MRLTDTCSLPSRRYRFLLIYLVLQHNYLKRATKKPTQMSGMIHHITRESKTVKTTLEAHYSDLLLCSCHRQAMKALSWQRKQLNEVVHIFHCCVWKRRSFKFTTQTPQSAQPVCYTVHTEKVTSVALTFFL